MNEDDLPDFLQNITQQLGSVCKPESVTMAIVDSAGCNVPKMIEDRVCGLLMKDSLTVVEISLLSALLKKG